VHPRPTREQLIELAKTDPEQIADLVLALFDRFDALEAKVKQLERNSRSSSKPPSSDSGNFTNQPKPKSLRNKSSKKPGGQKGHPGNTLRQSKTPDEIIEHRFGPAVTCPICGEFLTGCGEDALHSDHCEVRQVFELPAFRIQITEHRAERIKCPNCETLITAEFPSDIKAPTQYGPQVKAVALYLNTYQLIPFQRLAEAFEVLFCCKLSAGSLANFVKKGGKQASLAMAPVREELQNSALLHADETGCRVFGKRHWLHVVSTRWLSCYHINEKRGAKAFIRMGVLPKFTGNLIHDFFSSYYQFSDCHHFLCAAHLLRELIYAHEQLDQAWAGEMRSLLLEAKALRDQVDDRESESPNVLSEVLKQRIRNRYATLILEGLAINPEPEVIEGKRGRVARSKPLNLLIRLEDRYEEIMGFFEYAGVPFDNNQAERDLRMMKTREKISGTFRSFEHPTAFCDLRGVISSAHKQSRNLLEVLRDLLYQPQDLGKRLASFQIPE